MNRYRIGLVGFLSLLLLTGCAAMLVPETSNPAEKLAWASELIDNQNRPLPAETLIVEAVDIYKTQQNEFGLANAYRTYGLFFKSRAVNGQQSWYRKYGFNDKSATYDTRYERALEYFEKSKELLQKIADVKIIANVYLQIAITYQLMGNKDAACDAYDLSLKSEQTISKNNPELVTLAPKNLKSFEHVISAYKGRLGCKV